MRHLVPKTSRITALSLLAFFDRPKNHLHSLIYHVELSESAKFLRISLLILLPEKFLPFDWLRAEVFQLNLKYLHVKITVTMVTQNHQIISSHELRKNGGKISRFWNQEIQELKENSENQNTEKSTSTWLNVWTSWAENKNFKTNLLAYEAKQWQK